MAEKDFEDKVARLEKSIESLKKIIQQEQKTALIHKLGEIENHLTNQDTASKEQPWISGFFFGGAIFLVGVSLWFQMLPQSYVNNIFLIALGLIVMEACRRRAKGLKETIKSKP